MTPEIDNVASAPKIESRNREVDFEANSRMSLEGQAGNAPDAENQAKSTAEQYLPPFEIVTIPEDGLKLSGILWKPPGSGPFPAIIYNHGSEQFERDVNYGDIANFYVRNGFEFLLPLRRGHSYIADNQVVGSSDGVLFDDRLSKDALLNNSSRNSNWIKEQEVDNEDVAAAAQWLAQQPSVDRGKMIMSGVSFGGIQTCLAAEKGLGMRAFIPFAPAAMAWDGVPEVHGRLEQALQRAKAPVFLIQAENDYNLGPSQDLGPVLDRDGTPNRHEVYPAFQVERGPSGGHAGFALHGMNIWRQDVSEFLQEVENVTLPKPEN
jgi:carboxymethylenebutenolidase